MILSGTAWRSMSWAIGSFCVGSAGSYEFCTRRRALEKKAIERASEIMERKRLEKLEEVAKIRAERAENVRRKQEEERKEKGRWGWGGSGSGKAT